MAPAVRRRSRSAAPRSSSSRRTPGCRHCRSCSRVAEAFLYDAVRTPFGRYGGGLAKVRPDDLATHVVKALEERGLDPERVEEVMFGDANQAGEDNRNVARMAGVLAGGAAPGTGPAGKPAL